MAYTKAIWRNLHEDSEGTHINTYILRPAVLPEFKYITFKIINCGFFLIFPFHYICSFDINLNSM